MREAAGRGNESDAALSSGDPHTSFPPLSPSPSRLRWTLSIDPIGRPGHENMAVDSALLGAAREGEAFLRIYRWNPPCLSFGRNEPADARYDRALVTAWGIDTVRRPTGGRAVWHDAEVTYAVAAPIGTFGGLTQTYRAIHALVARALGRLGVAAQLAPEPRGRHPGPGAGACFASPAAGEVVVDGGKLVGSAQVREAGRFLQHGSILLADGQDLLLRVSRRALPPPKATSLTTCLGRAVSFDEVAAALAAEARTAWPGNWATRDLAPEPWRVRSFRNPGWTWRR